MLHVRNVRRKNQSGRVRLLVAVALLLPAACDSTLLTNAIGGIYNQTATRRGNVLIGFVNQTSARAVFAFGGYDPLNEDTTPVFSTLRLNGNSSSNQITQACVRVFTVGGKQLVDLVQKRGLPVTDPPALISGQVNFSTAPANDPLATEPTEGSANEVTIDLGRDYLCDGLLLFEFIEDVTAEGGFRIDYTFLPN